MFSPMQPIETPDLYVNIIYTNNDQEKVICKSYDILYDFVILKGIEQSRCINSKFIQEFTITQE
jgi:hypothetical protein